MINIFLFVFNRPDLLKNQIKSLQKFIKDDFIIKVIHDAHNDEYDEFFINICDELNVEYYQHHSDTVKNPSQYHADSVQFAYDNLLNDGDKVLFLDHDMFPIGDVEFTSHLQKFDVVGLFQNREHINYIWPGFMAFNYDAVKHIQFDFSPQTYNGIALDTGGGTFNLFNSDIKIQNSGVEYPETYNDYSLDTYAYPFELHFNRKFLHMRNASQWNNNYVVTDTDKTDILQKILTDIND